MKKDSPLSLGLDLGAHTAKAVLLEIGGSEPILKGFKSFPVSKEGQALSRLDLLALIRNNLSDWADNVGKITVAVSGKDVIVRYLEMPRMNLAELKNSLKFEAERYMPFKLTDALFDAQILLERTNVPNKMWVVLVAAKKAIVEEQLSLLKEGNMLPSCVEVAAISLINAYTSFSDPDLEKKGIVLIDLGATAATMNIIAHGVPFLSREVDFGGEMITQALIKEGAATYEQAETTKISGKVPFEGTLSRLIRPFLKEIKSSFDYYEGISDKGVDMILLSGGAASLKGLKEFLATHLNRPVEFFFPTKRLKKEIPAANAEEFDRSNHLYSVALGLAIRGKGK